MCGDAVIPVPAAERAHGARVARRPGGRPPVVASAPDRLPLDTASYPRAMPPRSEILDVAGREVTVTNPDKVFFPDAAGGPITKLDLVRYYVAVADGALRGAGGRPMALKRFPNGAAGDFFFQKRAPDKRPDWIRTVELSFPSGRTADEIVVDDAAGLAWVVNLGCIDLNPHPVRADDLDHPDELRVDLDPVPGVELGRRPPGGPRRPGRPSPTSASSAGRRPPATGGSTSTSGSSAAGPSPRSAAPPWPWPATSSGASPTSPPASGGRRSATASSSTTTRTRRTGRSRRAYSVRPRPGRASVDAADAGTRSRTWTRRPSPSGPSRTASPATATRTRGSTTPSAASTACSSCRPATRRRAWATRRGRRTTRRRSTSRRACSRRSGG